MSSSSVFLGKNFSTDSSKVVFVLSKPFFDAQICRNGEKISRNDKGENTGTEDWSKCNKHK